MAQDNVTTNIVVNSNFSSLIGDLNKASAALMNFRDKLSVSNKALAQQVAVINRTFAETMRSTGQFSTHFVSLNSDVEKFGSQLDKGQIKLNQFFRVFNDHTKTSGGIIRELAQQQVRLQNAILQPLGRNAEGLMQYNVHIPRGLDTVKNRTALAKQELQIMNKVIQQGSNQLINWGKNTQWAGRQLTVGLTVPLAAFGKAAADAFAKADQELTRLTKVYGGVAATSTAELKKIRNEVAATAADLAKSYGASFQDTIALASDIAATGKQGNELLNSVRETTRLAVLGEVDRQDAMKATLAIQTAFKQNTKELGESINFLNAVENQTSTTLADLVEAIPKAGPVIQGLGGDVKDLALYLTAMREGGISASEGANALKSGLASLINPTKVALGMFQSFGIDLKGIVDRNAGDVTNTILELQSALDKLDPLQKQKALEQLFGKFQFARMNALFSNLGKQGSQTLQVLDLMKASTQDLANIAGRELSQVTESASGKYRRALEGLKADLAGVGDQFLKINTALINIVDKVIDFATNLPKPVKQLLSVLGMFTAAAGPLIMLTGVLGNFIGYVVKGIFHLRSLFKGGEGWKLLTPEILAANRAGSLAEQTFYSDAKAATVFNQAVQGLTGSLAVLESKLNSGILNIAPQMTATAMGLREVNPQHPLLSEIDTRSMSHMNPVAGMNEAERQAQTLFGVLPGAPKVNQRIGANPQMYMTNDLPNVVGVSQVRGVSTGVVAAEAAKWHAMTAALAMQSKTELARLKTEIATTGLVTEELSTAYQAVLPKMNELVASAAAEAAQIVESARVGKISADKARAEITALNARIEQMMVQTATSTASGMGRTIDVTKVPLLDQPIVDASGKSNLKELTKPGRTRDLLNKIAGVLGVKTYGAGYSIETTRPKRFAQGDIVPGTGNQDTVPALLTPGEFVVTKEATQKHLPLLKLINNGDGNGGLKFRRGGIVPMLQAFMKVSQNGARRPMVSKELINQVWGERLSPAAKSKFYEPKGNAGVFGADFINAEGKLITTNKINKDLEKAGVNPKDLISSILSVGQGHKLSTDVFLEGIANANLISQATREKISKQIFEEYSKKVLGMQVVHDYNNPVWSVSNSVLSKELSGYGSVLKLWEQYSKQPGSFAHPIRRSSTAFLNSMNLNDQVIKFANLEASGKKKFYHAKEESNPFIKTLNSLIKSGGQQSFVPRERLAEITAKWPKKEKNWPLAKSYILNNQDPLHGPLMIGRVSGTPGALYYDKGKIYPNTPSSFGFIDQLPIGSPREQALYALKRYMLGTGDPSIMSLPAVKSGLAELSQRWTGTAYRGIKIGDSGSVPGLPNHVARAIYDAEKTGNFDALIGKNFFMRSASWSEKSDVAQRFGTSQNQNVMGTVLQVALQNRKVVPASKLNPEIGFDEAGIWPGANKENEMLFGGAFRIVSAEPGKIVLATAPGKIEKRERGGDVKSGTPYIVGEKGPELFVPGKSGTIVPRYNRGGLVRSMLGQAVMGTMGYIGGSAIGESIAGSGGSMVGGMLGSMIGGISLMGRGSMGGDAETQKLLRISRAYDKSVIPITKWKNSLSEAALSTNKLTAGLGRMLLSISKTNALLAVGTVVAFNAYQAWDKAAKARTASQDAIRINKEDAAQLGITYRSAIGNIKATTDAIFEQRKLLEAKAAGAAGVGGGVNLTVKQLKALQKEVKSTSPDIIKMFDNMKDEDVVKNTADLKAQMVAGGIAAQDATNKIYALLSLSNKARFTTAAFGTGDFKGIYDQRTAAKYSVSTTAKALTNITDKKELVNTFDQGLNAIESYYSSISRVKNATGKWVFDNQAVAKTMKEIQNTEAGRQKIGAENLRILLQQKPELNNILSSSDSIASAWAKYKLYTAGVSADLSKISGAQAQGMLQVVESIKNAATALTTTTLDANNPFSKLVALGNKAKAAAKAAQTAADNASKNAQKNADAEMKKIDAKITKINEEYDARRRLIEYQADKESYQISLRKEQLNYQQKVANGDLEGAAQAQLNLRQINLEYQKQQALIALEDKRNADLKKAEKERQATQDKLNASQEKAAQLAAAAAKAQEKANSISILQQSIANTIAQAAIASPEQLKLLGKSFESDLKALAKIAPDVAKSIPVDTSTRIQELPLGNSTSITTKDYAKTLAGMTQGKGTVVWDAASKTAMGNFGLTLDKFNSFWADLLGLPDVKKAAEKNLKVSIGGKGMGVYQRAAGGLISGPGTGTSDSIFMPMLPQGKYAAGAYVSTGEFVVKSSAVKKPGALNFLNKLNYDSSFQVPNNMWKVAGTPMSGPANITIAPVIHAAPGMDENMIADLASRKAFAMLKDAGYMQNRSIGSSKVVGR